LLDKGANINAKSKNGDTALIVASEQDHVHMDVVKVLLARGADANVKTSFQGRPLLHAAFQTMELVHALLANGADVNGKDENGETALMIALGSMNYDDMVPVLLAKQADVNLKNKDGETALMVASKRGYETTIELIRKAGAVR
jgi:uncharacterized protein